MGRKIFLCLRRRSIHIRFLYYVILFLIVFLVIRFIKLKLKGNATKFYPLLKGVDIVDSAESEDENLKELLKVESTSKLCRKSKQIDIYELCYETNLGKIPTNNIVLFSIDSKSSTFEEELPYELENVQVKRLFNENPSYWNKVLKFSFKVPWFGSWIWQSTVFKAIDAALETEEQTPPFALMKIGPLSDNLESAKASLIQRIVDYGYIQRFNQLYFNVNNVNELKDGKEWIEIIRLLKSVDYQLFSVHQSDDCTGSLSCSFGTSWLRIDPAMKTMDEEINPLDPNFDFGGKLHTLLKTTSLNCRRKVMVPASVDKTSIIESISVSRWPVCLDDVSPPCSVYSAKIGGSELFESILARLGCAVYVFDPTFKDSGKNQTGSSVIAQNIKKFNWTMGSVNARIISGFRQPDTFEYVKASEVLKKLGHENQVVDILRLDLHGGEWDVVESILSAEQQTNYQQVLLTVHVWSGEDRFNLLDRLLKLKKLFKANFRIFHSEQISEKSRRRENEHSEPCCYVIGLLNTNLIS